MMRVPSTRAFRDEEKRWDAFEDRLANEVNRRRACGKGLSPYDKPRSYLKREVYRHVLERLAEGRAKELQQCIELARDGYMPNSPTFGQNPFHWTLLGVQHVGVLKLEDYDVSRFGRQLAYAAIHRVPPQLLIGFLFQTGSPGQISKKFASGAREEWQILELPALPRLA
jgi:hypothetical protein